MKYSVIVHCLQDERLFDGAVHLLIYFMAMVIQQKLWVSAWQVRNSRLVVLLSSICVCRCSVRHCQSLVKWFMSIHNRSAIPDTVLGARMCRVFLLALGKKKVSAVLPTWYLFSRGKEPVISGSQKPPCLFQRDGQEIQSSTQKLQNWWGHPLALPHEFSAQKITCDCAWTDQTCHPFKRWWCLIHTWRSPLKKPLRELHPCLLWEVFHRAGGQQSGPVFSIVKLCGECVRGFMFQCMLWVVHQWQGRIQVLLILITLFQILLCFSFSSNESVAYTYAVV